MKTINITIGDNVSRIDIGIRGENDATEVVFDLSSLISTYGQGAAVLMAKRSMDTNPYPCTNVTQEGGTLTWVVTDLDTAYPGHGYVELAWYVDSVLAKTIVYMTFCNADIGMASQTPPDPYESWVDTLTELGAETLQNAQDAEAAQTAAETAQGKAEDAQEAAEVAQGKAEDAQEAAETAQGLAETAQGLAEAAEIGAEAARDAILNMSATAEIGDDVGTPSVVVTKSTVEGHENLNFAFDNLKSNGIVSITKTGTSGLTDTYTILYDNGETDTFEIKNGAEAVDPTLSISGAAADAKVTGQIRSAVLKDVTYPEWGQGSYNYPDGADYASTSRIRLTKYVSSQMGQFAVKANVGYEFLVFAWNATTNAYVGALMTSNAIATSGTPAWVTSFNLQDYPNYKFKVALRYSATPTANIPVSEYTNCLFVVNAIQIDKTLSVSGDAADAKSVGDILCYDYDIDLSVAIDYKATINTSNKWQVANDGRKSYIYPIPMGAKYVTIIPNSNGTAVAMLKTNSHIHQATPDYATGWSFRVGVEKVRTFEIPSDAKFIYILKTFSGTDYAPTSVVFRRIKAELPIGLHEMPENEGVLNIIKRCRQLTDIKWTPVVNLPRYMLVQRKYPVPSSASNENYLGTFKSGTEYKGVPYGRVGATMDDYGYNYATVGHYINFDTFISSVSNPDSKLSVDNVGSVSGHRSVIYATVCSGLTCFAINVSEVPTENIDNISGMVLVGKINDNGTYLDDSKFKVGDVLNLESEHTAIITDIIRDSSGNIQIIELSDASSAGLADKNYDDGLVGGVCRRKGWTIDNIRTGWGEYSVYRYCYAYNVPYTSNPYVNVGDEPDMFRVEHFPCMPYEGNGFTYKTGYIPNNAVKILISLDGYSYLRVFKDDVEVTGSPFAVSAETESIDVTEIGTGNYRAYLCNMSGGDVTNLSYACNWSIV